MTEKSKNKGNFPNLRFPGFTEEWKVKKFQDVVKINQGLQITISERLTEPQIGAHFYITNEFLKDGSEKKYFIKNAHSSVLCTKEDILMTRTGNTGKVVTDVEGAFHNNFFKVAYPKSIVKGFLYNYLKLPSIQKQILRLAGTSTIPDLNHSDFYKIFFIYPSLSEQQKISSLLSLIDERILSQKKIIEELGVLKIQSRNNLISKVIKENHEVLLVKDILNYEQPTKYIVSNTDYSTDKNLIPVLTANKAFILGYTDENFGIYNKGNCIILDDFTMDLKYVDFSFKVKSSAIKILTPKQGVNLKFVFEYFSFLNFSSTEHKRHYISEIEQMSIVLPSIEIQSNTADFLSKIDEKLNLEIDILNLYTQQKKYLLSNLFI